MTAEEILKMCGLSRESVQKLAKKMGDPRSIAQRNEDRYASVDVHDRGEDNHTSDLYDQIHVGFNNGGATTRKGTYRAFMRNKKAR